jgi:hypothetical protein
MTNIGVSPPPQARLAPIAASPNAVTAQNEAPFRAPDNGVQRLHAQLSARVVIEFDAAAARFVQTLIAADALIVRRFPDERQLAFSRGVNAYRAAMTRG